MVARSVLFWLLYLSKWQPIALAYEREHRLFLSKDDGSKEEKAFGPAEKFLLGLARFGCL